MHVQLLIGMVLIMVTVLVHGISLDYLIYFMERFCPIFKSKFPRHGKALFLSVTVLGIFVAHVIEIWIWALIFLSIGEMENVEAALYFSTVSFTTVGYGDVILSDRWRMLGSVEAANGMLLFGWSTAFIFEVMRSAWEFDSRERNKKVVSVS